MPGSDGGDEIHRLRLCPPSVLPAPDIREHLLAGTLRFVLAAMTVPGVLRISLIGSLTTAKRDPRDADVLVIVTDDMDLTSLASLGRRLKGYAQQQNHGADIFVADPTGHYVGRICHWKDCRPGVRLSCDARHCGRRQYLHDDLDDVTLNDDLVASPPIIVWPAILARVPVPADVERGLLEPLRSRDVGRGKE